MTLATTQQTAVIVMMSEQEARHHVNQINNQLANVRWLLLELHEREGWKALGYSSWRECVVSEFEQSQAYLYRLLSAAQVEQNILPDSPIGEIPESQLRPLAKLEPEEQRKAWERAKETAPKGRMTAAHVKATVKEMKEPPPPKEQPPVIIAQTAPPPKEKPATIPEPPELSFDEKKTIIITELSKHINSDDIKPILRGLANEFELPYEVIESFWIDLRFTRVEPEEEPPTIIAQTAPPPKAEPPTIIAQTGPLPKEEPPTIIVQTAPPPKEEPPTIAQTAPPPKVEPPVDTETDLIEISIEEAMSDIICTMTITRSEQSMEDWQIALTIAEDGQVPKIWEVSTFGNWQSLTAESLKDFFENN